jgi:hypothetical protein
MFNYYTDDVDNLRDSLEFSISNEFLSSITTIERYNIGKKYEKTIVYVKCESDELKEFNFYISRRQHKNLTNRFDELQKLKNGK